MLSYTLADTPDHWTLSVTGGYDDVMDVLESYTDGDTEEALNLFESADNSRWPEAVTVTLILRSVTTREEAAEALARLLGRKG